MPAAQTAPGWQLPACGGPPRRSPAAAPLLPAPPRFFFALANTRAGQAYVFNVVNLLKDDSLYARGMLPLVHSERRAAEEARWARGGGAG